MVDLSKKIRFAWSVLRRKIVHVNLQLLYTCNFKCRICDFWKEPYSEMPSLSVEQVKVITEKLARIGPQVISIGGGEPLLHKNLLEIVRILSKNNFPVMICNGWFMTPELAKALFQAGMYEVSISIDYASPAKHDEQRGMKGAFVRAVEALRMLQENRVYPHQRVHLISVVMEDNIDEIDSLIKLSRELGVTYLVTLYSDNRGRKHGMHSNSDISSRLLELKAKYPEFVALRGYIGRFSEAINNGGIDPCYAGKNLINIGTTGNVSFCIDNLEASAGNILTDDIRVIQKNLIQQRGKIACKGCWTSCRGSIETLMYGKNKLKSFLDYYEMTKDVAVEGGYCK
ncbi:MAG: radical SAM protein [Candidatus Riflebacteria bacterium]|nr:radical SAM protein [Candidatus Riflebacteria bacterium]